MELTIHTGKGVEGATAEPDVGVLDTRITEHLAYYKDDEKADMDRARSYYRGDFWAESKSTDIDTRLSSKFAQKNLIYAVVDTAISSLLGPNPQVAAMPQTPDSQEMTGAVNGLMTWAFRTTNMRRRSALALMDAVLCKRGIFKVSWDAKADAPVLSNPDPASVFFDLSARDPDDIRYWIQACPLTPAAYRKKVESKRYVPHPDIKAEAFPTWLRDDVQRTAMSKFSGSDKRILVYEYYNREDGTVIHYHKDTKHVLFRGTLDFIPFGMFSLNHSGVDCTGLSEVQLILDQQTNINQLLTLWKRIVYMQVPKILYDAGKIDSSTLDKAMAADVGGLVPVDAEGTDELRTFKALFYEMPLPEIPEAIIRFIDRLENDAAFLSALAEAARGQVAGAKTATEMTIIDAQTRTRLATREGHLHTALEDIASKMFYLMQRFMKKPKLVRLTGSDLFTHIGVQQLKELRMDFEMVAYNPLRKNPAVVLETLQAMFPILAQAPNINLFKAIEALVRGLALPNDIIIPEAQARKMQAEAAAAQQAAELEASKGGAAVVEDETGPSEAKAVTQGEASNMPPELMDRVRQMAVQQGMSPPQ
jgi:hypothetical protein